MMLIMRMKMDDHDGIVVVMVVAAVVVEVTMLSTWRQKGTEHFAKHVGYVRLINSNTFFLISLSLGETLLLEPFDGKVYDLLPVFLPELLSCPSNHLCLAPIFWLVFLSLSFRLS